VNDPLITRFAKACGATGPLDLQVDVADGGVLAQGSVPMPFTLVGRDDACDVTLTDAEVNPRHAWLQVIGGKVFAVDLGSRTGLGWPNGGTGSDWLDVGSPVRVGPFQLRLRSPVSTKPVRFPEGYNPLQSDAAGVRSRPAVALEFRNGRRAKDRWSVNRFITLVGRAPECKIHLTAEDIAGYHCGLVLTPDGLWVVDLSGQGVVVNGERMRISPLQHAAELWVGRFLIGVQYPGVAHTPALGQPGTLTPPTPLSGLGLDLFDAASSSSHPSARRPRVPPAALADDEVPLGVVPTPDPANGLPSSHIMADAFRFWGAPPGVNGPVSNPILVSGSGPTPPIIPIPPAHSRTVSPTSPPPRFDLLNTPPPAEADPALAMLRQLSELHTQMFSQFQQSLVLLVQLFGCLRRDQLPSVQRELARLQELNAELGQLQGEVARRAAEAAGPIPPPSSRIGIARHAANVQTPPPEPTRAISLDATALHDWVMDRIDSLQRERQARWQSLVGMFNGIIA